MSEYNQLEVNGAGHLAALLETLISQKQIDRDTKWVGWDDGEIYLYPKNRVPVKIQNKPTPTKRCYEINPHIRDIQDRCNHIWKIFHTPDGDQDKCVYCLVTEPAIPRPQHHYAK